MQLSAGHVAELCDELTDLLAGWTIKDVQGLPPRDVLLVLEPANGEDAGPPVLRVRLSADPEAPRLHLQHGRVHRHSGPDGPFFRRLAEELPGAELRAISPVRGDRIALLELRTANGRRGLLLELFGRHANMALLGPGDVVLELLAPARTKEGAPRLAPGAVWRAPDSGRTPRAEPPLVEAFPAPTAPPPGRDPERAPLSWRVESDLGAHAEEARDDTLRRDLRQRLKRRLERVDGLLRGLAQKADAASELDRARQDAELLKASLAQLRRGLSEVELLDWFAPEPAPRRIELDPRRSPQENVERAFARIKKLERGAAQVEVERARALGQHTLLTELLNALEPQVPDQAGRDPIEIEQRALDAGLLERRQEPDVRKRKAPAPRRPYRTFAALSGAEIRVGRNAKDNDELTLRHTRGNDLWLHTADVPGSHVVLRLEHGGEAQPEDVLDAATLAVHFSPARGRERVPVHVVHRKHVSKPKGAKPGLVQLAGGRSMTVRLDAERLERLLRGAAGGDSGPERGDPR